MKHYIIKLFTFGAILFFIVGLLTFISVKLLNKSDYYSLSNETTSIMLGHSHSACAYNDSLINGLMNFSKNGESYFYTYLKARKIIPNNKQIKTVFIEFENSQIDKIMDEWTWGDDRLSRMFPRYFPLMDYSDFKFLWNKNSSAILNSSPKTFIDEIGFTYLSIFVIKKGVKSNSRFGGYFYSKRNRLESLMSNDSINKVAEKVSLEISETNMTYLSKIIELCEKNNVKVVLVRSPVHVTHPAKKNELEFKKVLHERFNNVNFLDFKDFPLINSEYGDPGHLNFLGAIKFSNWFNELLNSDILTKSNKQDYINKEIEKIKIGL